MPASQALAETGWALPAATSPARRTAAPAGTESAEAVLAPASDATQITRNNFRTEWRAQTPVDRGDPAIPAHIRRLKVSRAREAIATRISPVIRGRGRLLDPRPVHHPTVDPGRFVPDKL